MRGTGQPLCSQRRELAAALELWPLLLQFNTLLRVPYVRMHFGPSVRLKGGWWGKLPNGPQAAPPRFASEVAEKENRAKVTVTQAVAAADALARRVFLQHTHGRRATHLQSLGSSRSAPPSGVESKPCLRGSGVRAEGSCPGRELSALARLAGRHAAAWSADGPGLEHRLL